MAEPPHPEASPEGSGAPPGRRLALLLDERDNVATALVDLARGTRVPVGGLEVELRADIPFAHKFALRPIAAGEAVVKYGETIGLATAAIQPGDHVHRHNLDHRVESIIFRMREATGASGPQGAMAKPAGGEE